MVGRYIICDNVATVVVIMMWIRNLKGCRKVYFSLPLFIFSTPARRYKSR